MAKLNLRFDLSPPRLPDEDRARVPSIDSSTAAAAYLDKVRSSFHKSVPIMALRVPAKDIGSIKKTFAGDSRDVILTLPRVSSVAEDVDTNHACASNGPTKLLLLSALSLDQVPSEVNALAQSRGYQIVEHQVKLDYTWYTSEEVLSALLPSEPTQSDEADASAAAANGLPTGYTIIGHIAHLNLREAFLPYRFLIGQVILEKNRPSIRTVVNKLDTIDNEFRFFAMQLLAGEPEYTVTSSESNCQFTFDFRKVYFNSRLHTEHARIVSLLQRGEVVVDAMAGVGPFALPAAKNQGCRVYANDLNPASFESLEANNVKNRTQNGVGCFCQDGREFIRESVKRVWKQEVGMTWQGVTESRTKAEREKRRQRQATASTLGSIPQAAPSEESPEATSSVTPPSRLPDHYIMNLPASAIEFLDAFIGLYTGLGEAVEGGREAVEAEMQRKASSSSGTPRPVVHVHTFTKDLEDPAGDICRRANSALGLSEDDPSRLLPPPKESITTSAVGSQGPTSRSRVVESQQGSCSLHWVRKVAPNKDMYCLSFPIPDAVLFAPLQK